MLANWRLQLPIYFYPFPEEKMNFFFFTGPYLSIKTNAELFDVKLFEDKDPLDFSDEYNAGIRKTDWGIIVGTGLVYSFGKLSVFASTKYHLGLSFNTDSNLYRPTTSFVDDVLKRTLKTRAYGAAVGVLYPISR